MSNNIDITYKGLILDKKHRKWQQNDTKALSSYKSNPASLLKIAFKCFFIGKSDDEGMYKKIHTYLPALYSTYNYFISNYGFRTARSPIKDMDFGQFNSSILQTMINISSLLIDESLSIESRNSLYASACKVFASYKKKDRDSAIQDIIILLNGLTSKKEEEVTAEANSAPAPAPDNSDHKDSNTIIQNVISSLNELKEEELNKYELQTYKQLKSTYSRRVRRSGSSTSLSSILSRSKAYSVATPDETVQKEEEEEEEVDKPDSEIRSEDGSSTALDPEKPEPEPEPEYPTPLLEKK